MESTNKQTNKHVCNTDWIENALGEGFSKWQASLLPDKPQCAMGAFAPVCWCEFNKPPTTSPFAPKLCAYVSRTSHQLCSEQQGGWHSTAQIYVPEPSSLPTRETAHQEWSLAHWYPLNRVQTLPERMLICTGQNSATKRASNLKDIKKKKKKALLTSIV